MLHTGILQLLEQMPETEAEKDAYIRELQSTLKNVRSENIDLQQPLGGKLKTAVGYVQGQRPYLENYLKDSSCQISNNLAENTIRPITVGRKNWLFSNSVAGAKASAVIYSLEEPAKANNLSPRDYLEFLLENLPNMDAKQHSEELDELMPWGDFIRSRFGLDEDD